jgi:aminoglycoside phosphotransferase (APT) family kinase protein
MPMSDLIDKPATIRTGEELDAAKLEPYLRQKFPNESGDLKVRQYLSGHSNLTYAIRLGERELVLRRPPFGSKVKSAHDMSREFRVLAKLHAVYAPAPEVLAFCDDESILGAPFYVMQPIHGVILRKNLPPEINLTPEKARQLNESLIDNLIALHQVDYAAAGLSDLGKPEGYLARQVRGWIERYHGSKTHDYAEVEKISQWMQENMPATQSTTLIHNDYKFDNVVLDATDITKIKGVLDWEMATVGDPLTDLGTTMAYWVNRADPEDLKQNLSDVTTPEGSLSRAEVAAHYANRTNSDISQIAFYLTFARFKLAVIVQQIFYRYHQGLTKDARFAPLPARVIALLRAALHTAQTNQI